jgi:hypothetical protein
MKTLVSFVIVLFIGFSATAQEKAEFKFVKETIDYGNIAQNSNGVRVFEFTNIGKTPLVITRVQASCGCTVPKKPENPILPGEKGKIEVSYNTKKPGRFSKTITIFSNAKNERKVIRIKGVVEKVGAPEKKKSMMSEDNS